MKILAVDDDLRIRELLDLVLGVHGYTVKTAQNGEHGMAAFAAEPFDLVLTDIGMPVQDGNALARFVKSSERRVPVLALTGEEENASELFDRVLGKPVYTRELISTIEELLSDEHDLTKHYA